MTLTAKNTPQNRIMFEHIKKVTGWGKIYVSDKKTNPTLRYVISTKDQLTALFQIFETYPLLTNNSRYRLARQKAWMLDRILEPEFKYSHYQPTAQSLVNLPYFDAWLVGFIEAESSFSFTNGRPRFGISQNNDRFQLEAIVLRLGISTKIYSYARKNNILHQLATSNRADNQKVIQFMESPHVEKLKGEKLLSYTAFKHAFITP